MILSFIIASFRSGGILFARFYGPKLTQMEQQARWMERVRNVTVSQWTDLAADFPEQVALLDDCTVVFKLISDVVVIVVGNREHDALLLLEFVRQFDICFRKVCKVPSLQSKGTSAILSGSSVSAEKRILSEYWNVCLVVDEMIDEGTIDHLDSAILQKILTMKPKR